MGLLHLVLSFAPELGKQSIFQVGGKSENRGKHCLGLWMWNVAIYSLNQKVGKKNVIRVWTRSACVQTGIHSGKCSRLRYAGNQHGLSPPCLGMCEFLDLWNLGIDEFLALWNCHNQTIHLFQIFVVVEVLVLVCDWNNWPKLTKKHKMFRLSQFCGFFHRKKFWLKIFASH